MRNVFLIILAGCVLLISVAVYFLYYAGILGGEVADQIVLDPDVVEKKESSSLTKVEYKIEEVARGLFVPWSLVFTSEDRILVAERNGYIKQVTDNNLDSNYLYYFEDVATGDEEGLMGMAAHPNYSENNYIYACYAYSTSDGLADRVVRLVDNGDSLEFDQVIIQDIPAARFHAGCRVKFGPDEKLYITTGDATDKNIAQELSSLGGKILRLNDDGSIPEDNPIENSYVYSLGHRNPQGIDWDSDGNLYSSEHGPSGFDGPGGGDELNMIAPGENYGWPLVSHDESRVGLIDPLIQWTPAIAPASLLVYKSDLFPQFNGDVFIGGLRGEGVYRVIVVDNKVGKWEKLITGYGRVREVTSSPNGEIYFTTSNNDGRGKLFEGDDKIFKITPAN